MGVRLLVSLFALLLTACASIPTTGPDGPKGIVFAPRQGDGPPVLVISGLAGPDGLGGAYRTSAQRLADEGFRAVLIDGNAVASAFREDETARENLRKAIVHAGRGQRVAIVGFSLGGMAALSYAASMEDVVSLVILFYPVTRTVGDAEVFAGRLRVPVLAFMGDGERSLCCDVRVLLALRQAAARRGATFEVVTYPDAEHGFNLVTNATYRKDYDEHSWQRSVGMLRGAWRGAGR